MNNTTTTASSSGRFNAGSTSTTTTTATRRSSMNDASGVQVSIPEEEEEEEGKRTEDEDEDEMDDVEQYVQIRPSAQTQNEAICRVTCPDKTGLGADLARTIFDFGLVIVKGDFATDGQWAFVLLTIYAPPSTHELQQGGIGKKKKKKSRKARRKSKKRAAAQRMRKGSNEDGNSENENKEGDEEDDNDDESKGSDDSDNSAVDVDTDGDNDEDEDDDDDTSASDSEGTDEEKEREEEEKAVNWKLLQMRLENLCPKKLSITKSGKDSNGNSINESDRAERRSGSGVGGTLQKGGRHARKSSSRLDEIINANNKNGGRSHLEDINRADDNGNNNEDDAYRRRRGSNSNRLNQQQSYSDFHDYFDDDDEYYKPSTFILRVEVDDRVGLLRDLTLTLWECALIVQRAHISTSPANTAVDLFYVMDTKDELPNEDRVEEIAAALRSVIAHGHELKVGLHQVPFYAQGDYITRAGWLDDFSISQVESASATEYPSCDVWVDNLMSDRHTVFQMISRDRKGLLYDVLRASKELKVQIYYAKVEMKSGGLCEIDLFCERMTNDENTRYLCQKYKQNIERPVAVQITSKGIDDLATELRVICPLDFTGVTRPRVLLDCTEALRRLRVMVFKADIVIDPGFSEGEQGQLLQEDFMIHRIDSIGNEEGMSDGVNAGGVSNAGMMMPNGGGSSQQLLNTLTTATSQTSLRKSGSSKSVHRTLAREVHRFILTDERGMPISNVRDRKNVCDAVLKTLLGLRGANEYFPGMSEISEGSDFYASQDEYDDSDNDDDDENIDVGHYGIGRIGGVRRANSFRRKKSSGNNKNREGGGGGYISSAIGFAKRLFFFS